MKLKFSSEVNALLDTRSQITLISESYYKNFLSKYPLVPVDIPNLKVERAGGLFIPYLRMVIIDIKVPHLTRIFKAKVVQSGHVLADMKFPVFSLCFPCVAEIFPVFFY